MDVTYSMFDFLVRAKSFRRKHLTRLDLFSLMVASIAHDMGHRGVSNSHLVKTRDVLAMTYNDSSPQVRGPRRSSVSRKSVSATICVGSAVASPFALLTLWALKR